MPVTARYTVSSHVIAYPLTANYGTPPDAQRIGRISRLS